MKYVSLLIIVLVIAGCKYTEPLTEEHTVPIDPAILGEWQHLPENGGKPNPEERMVVLKYSDTEYVIVIDPSDRNEGGMYFRGYPIRIGGLSCVQLQLIGFRNRPVDDSEKNIFDVAVYQLKNNELTAKTLNPDLIDKRLNGKELKAAFLANKDNKKLFTDQNDLRFVKVEKQY